MSILYSKFWLEYATAKKPTHQNLFALNEQKLIKYLIKVVRTAISEKNEKLVVCVGYIWCGTNKFLYFSCLQNGAFPTTPLIMKGINPFYNGGLQIHFVQNCPLNKTGYYYVLYRLHKNRYEYIKLLPQLWLFFSVFRPYLSE